MSDPNPLLLVDTGSKLILGESDAKLALRSESNWNVVLLIESDWKLLSLDEPSPTPLPLEPN